MFTGIIEALGHIAAKHAVGGDLRLRIGFGPPAAPVGAAHGCDRNTAASPANGQAIEDPATVQTPGGPVAAMGSPCSAFGELRLGESIAVSGVCLTVVAFDDSGFEADVSNETLALTTLGRLSVGATVNLERAMLPSTRFGGHMVAGHVDGVGQVLAIEEDARSHRWRFAIPHPLMRYVAVKGSIAIDGVSLTVNAIGVDWLSVNLVPHTIAHTAFGVIGIGAAVNVEVDLVARYLERSREWGLGNGE